MHGDSPVYFLQHAKELKPTPSFEHFKFGEFGIAEDLQNYELSVNLFDAKTYSKFAATALNTIQNVKTVVAEHREAGFQICFVGAAAKAITLLNAAQIKPDHLLDESPLKIGLYAPGCNTLVEPLTAVASWTIPTLFVLSAWNFRFELTSKINKLGQPTGSKFYTYFPQPQWISN